VLADGRANEQRTIALDRRARRLAIGNLFATRVSPALERAETPATSEIA
jgi:hypothetical protein